MVLKVLHLNAGNENGGGMHHILRLLDKLQEKHDLSCTLGVFEKKELYDRAKELNIPTVYFPNQVRLSVPLLKKLQSFINEKNFSHVHTHGPRANVYMNYIHKRLPARWVLTVHSDPFYDFHDKGIYGKMLTKIHVNAIKNARKIISVSDAFYPRLLEIGAKRENIVTVHNGIDFHSELSEEFFSLSKRMELRERFGFRHDDFLILMVARLEAVKGHAIAFKAFHKLMRELEGSFHLLIVGEGSLKDELVQLATKLKIEPFVHFFGHRNDVDSFYYMTDVTLLTSFSESFPFVLLESARAKTPVISTDVGDVKYLILNENFGWKVPVNNPKAVADALKEAYLLHRQNRLQWVGENLHHYAENYFSLDQCANKVFDVYKSLIIQDANSV